MIFVTIGTQEPFDRLIRTMDEVASILYDIPIVAQVSKTNYRVKNMKALEFIEPKEFDAYFSESRLIVSHAGMGTIISALEKQKPIIVLPRLTKFGEHRSDHQLATAKRFDALKYINVAYDEVELKSKVLELLNTDPKYLHQLGKYASTELISSIKYFIKA